MIQIHVDRYKYEVYSNLRDKKLRDILTRDARSTRFHACERFERCDFARQDDPGIVYVNPINIGNENWGLYLAKTRAELEKGIYPSHLVSNVVCIISPFIDFLEFSSQ